MVNRCRSPERDGRRQSGGFIFSLAVAFTLSALVSTAPVHAALTVTDSRGNTVTLAMPAQRIIALSPHAAELVFAAGAGAQLVAVSEHADTPAAVKTLPVVGNAHAVDLERLIALKPSLLVLPFRLSAAQQQTLRARQIALYVADAPTPEAIAGDIEALGILSGHADTAGAAAQHYRTQLNDIVRRCQDAAAPIAAPVPVFYQLWEPPLYTVGSGSLIDQAISRCGGRNIFSALTAPSPVVLREAVIAAQPQIIIMGATEQDFTRWQRSWQRWPQIPAVRRRAFIRIDPDLLHRPGPRFVEGMAALCQALHEQPPDRRTAH